MPGRLGRLAAEGAVVISHAPPRGHWLQRIARAALSLTVPVFFFLLTIALAWDLRVIPMTLLDGVLSPSGRADPPSGWLSVGHAVLPFLFLLSNLVNRRYGEDYAIAFVLTAWATTALLAIALLYGYLPNLVVPHDLPSVRIATAFFASLVLGQVLGVFVFDGTRGVVWWKAPLYSALTTTLVYAFIFYPTAYIGSDVAWLNRMSIDAGVKAAMSFAVLLPYLALRPLVRPLGGFGSF